MMPRLHTFPVVCAVMLVGGVGHAAAQKKAPATMSLFGGAPAQSLPGEAPGAILGMRPETVGATARFSLSLDTASNLRSGTAS